MAIQQTTRVQLHLMHRKGQPWNRLILSPSLNESLMCFRGCKPNLRSGNRANRPLSAPSVNRTKSHPADASHRTSPLLSHNRPPPYLCMYACVYFTMVCIRLSYRHMYFFIISAFLSSPPAQSWTCFFLTFSVAFLGRGVHRDPSTRERARWTRMQDSILYDRSNESGPY